MSAHLNVTRDEVANRLAKSTGSVTVNDTDLVVTGHAGGIQKTVQLRQGIGHALPYQHQLPRTGSPGHRRPNFDRPLVPSCSGGPGVSRVCGSRGPQVVHGNAKDDLPELDVDFPPLDLPNFAFATQTAHEHTGAGSQLLDDDSLARFFRTVARRDFVTSAGSLDLECTLGLAPAPLGSGPLPRVTNSRELLASRAAELLEHSFQRPLRLPSPAVRLPRAALGPSPAFLLCLAQLPAGRLGSSLRLRESLHQPAQVGLPLPGLRVEQGSSAIHDRPVQTEALGDLQTRISTLRLPVDEASAGFELLWVN